MAANIPAKPMLAVAAYLSAAAIWGAGATALPLKLDFDPASTIWLQAAAWGVWLTISGALSALTLARVPGLTTAFLRDAADGSSGEERDHVTGLPGRAHLRDRLDAALAHARRSNGLAALLLVDLDRFKSINDTQGHKVGDLVLRLVARRAASCMRETDSVARLEGDTFAIVAVDLESPAAIETLAGRLRAALGQAFRVGDIEVTTSASIGIAIFSGEDQGAEQLLNNAESALYRAKQSGRDSHIYFATDMTEGLQRRARLEIDLKKAVAEGEITPHYQPKVDLATGRICGVEALARWKHPHDGWISPAEFIPLAEECGLILPLGLVVLRQACAQAQAWRAAGLPAISVAVNFSPHQFLHGDIAGEIATILEESGLEGRYLEVELTESAVLRDPERVEHALNHVRSLGVKVALDDFGTGYSSLSYLKRLPLDMLKIDRAFVVGMDKNANDAAIVGAVIAMGRSLKLEIVAEGIENERVANLLLAMGCQVGQGYYFSPPIASDQLSPLLEASQPFARAALAADAAE